MVSVLFALVAVLLVLVLLAWAVLYQLIKQQGRLLLRQDELEQRLGAGGQAPAEPQGLPVGTALDSFRLPDLAGKETALEDFRGRKVVLVHWSPGCGYCDLIAGDLAGLQADLKKKKVQLLFVAYGEADANRELAQKHEIDAPILLLKDLKNPLPAFDTMGTPSAYLLDEQGKVARPAVVGADQVVALAREAAKGKKRKRLPGERDLSTSRIERNGRKAGTPAPEFRLPGVDGGEVALKDFRGRKVLVVLSDPNCGPCDELAPYLKQVHEEHKDNGLAVVLVGRGDAADNRRKAQEHGFRFPVVIQKQWELSKQFGIFATPVAFLIDEQGVIARDVAQGVDAIQALVPAEAAIPA